MRTADLVKAFRAAAWPTPGELNRFIHDAGQLPAADVEKLLEVLADPEAAADARGQEARRGVLETLLAQSLSKDLFKPLVKALPQVDEAVRRALVKVLPRCWDPARPDDIVQMFRSTDAVTRAVASELLGPLGGPVIINALSEGLKDPKFPGRPEAMDGLARLVGPRVVPILAAALPTFGEAEKIHAVATLADARVAGPRPADVLPALLSLFADPSDNVVVRAIGAFSVLCSEDEFFATVVRGLQSPRNAVVKAVVAGLMRFPSSARALDALEWKFKAGPVAMRMVVLDALRGMAHDRVVPVLAEALANPHILVRHKAMDILAELVRSGRINLQQTILWLMQSPDANVRRMAMEIALTLRDPEDRFWPDLLPFMGDADWWVRQRTVDAVVALAGRKLLARLPALTKSGSAVFRLYAAEALERLADPAGLGTLLDLVETDADQLVRERALEALGRVKDPAATQALVTWMAREEAFQLTCLEALRDLAPREAAAEVAVLLQSPDPDVRAAAVECLAAMDDARQAPQVAPLTSDGDPRVARLATELAERWRSYGSAAVETAAEASLDELLSKALDLEAEAVILAGGSRPVMRRQGQTLPLGETPLSTELVNRFVLQLLGPRQHSVFAEEHEVDTSYELRGRSRRFRLHVFSQLAGVTAVFQFGRATITPLEQLSLPDVVRTFGDYRAGLVLVAGPAGGGKSSSIHGILHHVNLTSTRHVITLENAIEVVHQPRRSIVTQREVGRHARDLPSALKGALREDPDIIVIDDLRDFDAISFALTAAETGHLVLGAMQNSTPTAVSTLERFVKAFPTAQQEAVQNMLAGSLRAVLCQKLVPAPAGGRVPVVEVLINTAAVANLIRKAKVAQVGAVIATSADAGMVSMEADTARRVKEGSMVGDGPAGAAPAAAFGAPRTRTSVLPAVPAPAPQRTTTALPIPVVLPDPTRTGG